jgi:hypothetical protein
MANIRRRIPPKNSDLLLSKRRRPQIAHYLPYTPSPIRRRLSVVESHALASRKDSLLTRIPDQ